ncbi:hypothetical protein [Brunnivagina elsteri]|uniref:Uncharacterized protein n=1 Tax=Brunnivagina elsteri CCALA 953 TaxID=987040 RepID=A0A2A2TGK6_9CYAN|nr:hypothetical protein [Calothrix elsteri]PAX52853.1 hypothetical protein CK510_16990 [Calothrix elsteri CCALA 953]
MSYCLEGDKPIVKYKFGTGEYRKFKAETSPITIISKTEAIPNTGAYSNLGYQVLYYSVNNLRTEGEAVLDYRLRSDPLLIQIYGSNAREINLWRCGETDWDTGWSGCDITTLVIDPNIKCPIAGKQRCAIQIFNAENNNLIFQDQGDCPCVFEVQCGNCPDEHIECKVSHYPGYCCVPCASTSNSIHNLANRIK